MKIIIATVGFNLAVLRNLRRKLEKKNPKAPGIQLYIVLSFEQETRLFS